ncbi:MAG: hypothetical protein II962_06180, partial [Spirochaetales bacterium]|nr:hypothetical protein [Spirochaetales bacterium]
MSRTVSSMLLGTYSSSSVALLCENLTFERSTSRENPVISDLEPETLPSSLITGRMSFASQEGTLLIFLPPVSRLRHSSRAGTDM